MEGLAVDQWVRTHGELATDEPPLDYVMTLGSGASASKPIQVGFLLFKRAGKVITWNSDELFVPGSLDGAGIKGRFLDAVIRHFGQCRCRRIDVLFDDGGPARDRAARWDLTATINFYKSRGFSYSNPKDSPPGVRMLTRRCRKPRQRILVLP